MVLSKMKTIKESTREYGRILKTLDYVKHCDVTLENYVYSELQGLLATMLICKKK